jgi:hypothetical protein
VARRSGGNLERLATVLRSLNARLRVQGLADEEAAMLPARIDKDTSGRIDISTWRTDAGDFAYSPSSPTRWTPPALRRIDRPRQCPGHAGHHRSRGRSGRRELPGTDDGSSNAIHLVLAGVARAA